MERPFNKQPDDNIVKNVWQFILREKRDPFRSKIL